jgi:superfamily I DNA/RNA helicase
MHLAKGLEFRTVAVMACDDEVIPLQERIEPWPMTQIWRMFTTRSIILSRSRAPAHVTICSSAALLPHLNSSTTCEGKRIEQTWPLIQIAFSISF